MLNITCESIFWGKRGPFRERSGEPFDHHFPFLGLALACFAQPSTSSCSLPAVLQWTFSLHICSFAGTLFDIKMFVCLPAWLISVDLSGSLPAMVEKY